MHQVIFILLYKRRDKRHDVERMQCALQVQQWYTYLPPKDTSRYGELVCVVRENRIHVWLSTCRIASCSVSVTSSSPSSPSSSERRLSLCFRNTLQSLHFAANGIDQSSFKLFWWAPKDYFISAEVSFRPFKVIEGHWFWY